MLRRLEKPLIPLAFSLGVSLAAYRGSRLKSAWATLIAGLAIVPLSESAASATPSLLWTGARGVAVHCLAQSKTMSNPLEFERSLCSRARVLASGQAGLPVKVVEAGDPAFIRNDTVVLLVHASVEVGVAGRMVAFTIRPYRPSGGDAEVYFGAAPRAFVTRGALTGFVLDAHIRAALDEILPSRRSAAGGAAPL